ncbi:MAG: tRNA lysidine(34) synthetase TilS, partial [Bryobacteraceae bacterium]
GQGFPRNVVISAAGARNAAALNALHPALARRVVRRAIELVRTDLRRVTFAHVESVRELASLPHGFGKRRLAGLLAVRSFGEVRLATDELQIAEYEFLVTVGECYRPPGLVLESVEPGGHVRVKEDIAWQTAPARLLLRGWRAGDAFRPVGEQREKKLKVLFQEARVPVWQRNGWPVLESRGKILWSKQFGPAADVAATGSESRVLRVRLEDPS